MSKHLHRVAVEPIIGGVDCANALRADVECDLPEGGGPVVIILLKGAHGELLLPKDAWCAALELACDISEGSVSFARRTKWFPKRSAQEFASALQCASCRVPEGDDWYRAYGFISHPYNQFCGAAKQQLRDLIAFCRAGAFSARWT